MASLNNDSNNGSMIIPSRSQNLLTYIDVILTPLVCLVGTVVNLLAVGAFMSKPLRRISCCLYLATRSIAVVGFLLCIGLSWSNTFAPLMQTDVVCKLFFFVSYFCPFISVWMVVAITTENFIRIAQPSRVRTFCTPRVAKMVIAMVCFMGVGVYNFYLWTFDVAGGTCEAIPRFFQTVLIINYVDSALTLLAPFILLLILVPLVALAALHSFERKKRLSLGNPRSSILDTSSRSPEAKVTHLLLAVSVVFLVLHTPFHAIRIKLFILTLADSLDESTSLDLILLTVFRKVYYLDTCASCAVYIIFGDNFRRVFCNLYFSSCKRRCATNAHATSCHVTPTSNCTTPLTTHTCIHVNAAATTTTTTTAAAPDPTVDCKTVSERNPAEADNHNDNDNDIDDGEDEDRKTRRALLPQTSSD